MPIYAYKCASCGHAKDALQRMSDDPLTVCPACGQATFQKQLTAAGFQLKGSGWYVTDFRGGSKAETAKEPASGSADASPAPSTAASPAIAPATTPSAAPSAAPAPKPAATPGGSTSS